MRKMLCLFFMIGFIYGQVDYTQTIQPIFNNSCTSCHGYSGGLSLTSYTGAMAGGNSGTSVEAGNHASSLLWQKVNNGSMPPGNQNLSNEQINLIAQWIDEGALETPQTYITIAEARALTIGSTATVRGIVTSPNYGGSFTSYYIQDATAGINLYASGSNISTPPTLNLGDSIEVTGEIATWASFLEIEITSESDYTLISSNNDLPEPQLLTISQFLTDPESYEHEFIRINGVSITNGSWPSANNSANLTISDDGGSSTLTMRIDSDTEIDGSTQPSAPFDLLGIAGQYCDGCADGGYQILPRYSSDFMAGTVPPLVADIVITPSSPIETDDVTVTATISDADGSISSAVLTYNSGSGDIDLPMSATGSDNLYTAVIPAQSTGTTVTFSITAVDNANNSTTSDDFSYLVISTGGQVTSIYDIQYTTDSSGDSPLDNQSVTISGIVTAEFWGSPSLRYFFVQDAEGPWNGILCYRNGWHDFDFTTSSGIVNSVAEGDSVSVTGTVGEERWGMNGRTIINAITQVIIHGQAVNMISPSVVTAGQIMTGGSDAEAYEGCLVQVNNVSVDDPDLGNGEWSVTDGTNSVRVGDAWNYYFFPESGQELAEVVGVMNYSSDNTKLEPRLARDVVEADGELVRLQRIQQVLYSDLIKAGEDSESDTSYMLLDTVTVQGIVTMPTGLSYAGDGVKFIFADPRGGPWSAILSYDPDNSAFPVLFEGDLIQATGYIYEYSTGPANMTELFIIEPINIIDFEQPLPPVDVVNTGDLRWPTKAEQWGNVMVRVEDAVVTDNQFQYDVFALDDGTGSVLIDDDSYEIQDYFSLPEQGGIGRPSIGYTIESAQGWVYHHYGSYSDSTAYKLCPLYPDDIVFGIGPPIISDISRDPCAPKATDTEVTVSCLIEDNSTITSAEIQYSVNGGAYQTINMSSSTDSTWTGVIPVTGDDEINYYIVAKDDGVDQDSVGISNYPYNIQNNQLGFVATDDLTIEHIQETPWPSGTTRYQDCEVTLKGIVTADTAQYNSAYSSYAFQDGTGQWSGLVFDIPTPGEQVNISRGDEVEVTGTINDFDPDWHFKFDGNTRLINSTVTILSTGNDVPEASLISCSDVSIDSEDGYPELYEGVLVRLNNVTITVTADELIRDWRITDNSGETILIDDDMANLAADNFMSTLIEGQELEYVIGIFNYSFGTYKVQIRDLADLGQTMGINNEIDLNPFAYKLLDNFPNPFNPETHIHFELGGEEIVKLMIYDALGRQVRTLINGQSYRPGFHAVNWDGRDDNGLSVSSGVYIYRIKAGGFIADNKMLLVK